MQATVSAPLEAVWDYLTGDAGLDRWLGPGARPEWKKGSRYRAADGTEGEVRSVRLHDRIRLTRRPPRWDHDSTLQVTVRSTPGGTAIRFHQERLAGAEEREAMRAHWRGVLAGVAEDLADG